MAGEIVLSGYWKKNLWTHVLLVLVAVIWGSTWSAGRFLSYGLNEDNPATLSPATSAWLRYAFAVSVFLAWSITSRGGRPFRFLPPDRKSWIFSIWLGFLGTMAYQLLFMHGMSWTAAGDASLIIPMNPVFTVMLAVPMLGQKISARMSIGLLVGICGVAVVVGWSPNSGIPIEHRILGNLMILFAALSWAATSNLTKIMLSWERGYSSLEIVVWYSVTGWALLSPWMLVENWGSALPEPSYAEWLTIAYLGIVSTVLSYVLFAKGIELIGPTAASSYVFLVPVFGVLGGWLLLGEEIGASMILGFVLIVAGVTEVQRESERLTAGSRHI